MNVSLKFRSWDNDFSKFVYSDEFSDISEFFSYVQKRRLPNILPHYQGMMLPDLWTGMITTNNEKEIYINDVVNCFDDGAKDPNWHYDIESTGVIEFAPQCFILRIPGKLIKDTPCVKQWEPDVILDKWGNAENIEIIGNKYETPQLYTNRF